jgi:hypothetical protein
MKVYQGSATFLYCRLKQNYKNIFSNTKDLMPFDQFKERIELGKEFRFAGALYTKNYDPKNY